MRYIDLKCPKCENITIDHFQRSNSEPLPRCAAPIADAHDEGASCPCLAQLVRVHLPTTRDNVIQDSIEGGVLMYNGLCNADGTPRRYYSKTEIRKEAERRGLSNNVHHIGRQGSDKSEHTTRWV